MLDLRTTDVEMSCGDYTLLAIAGPNNKDLPPTVQKKMAQHLDACDYHCSSQFTQSAVGAPITPELEKAALETVRRMAEES